jgi:DNA-binding IclR family transcriptional regulator
VWARGRLVAAVSISGPSFRLPAADLPQLAQLTVDAAATIGRRVAGETTR